MDGATTRQDPRFTRSIFAALILATSVAFPFLWAILLRHIPAPVRSLLESVLPPDTLPDVWPFTILVGAGLWGYLAARSANRRRPWLLAVAAAALGAVSVNVVLDAMVIDLIGHVVPPEPVDRWYLVALPVVTGIEGALAGALLGLTTRTWSATLRLAAAGAAAIAVPAATTAQIFSFLGIRVGTGNAAMAYVTGGALFVGVMVGGTVLVKAFAGHSEVRRDDSVEMRS